MTPRIQFRTSDDEYLIIAQNAANAGYSSVSQFVKELALKDPNTVGNPDTAHSSFKKIYEDVQRAIEDTVANEPAGFKFVLRDIVPGWKDIPQHENRPTGTIPKPLRASVGKHFYSEVKAGKFPCVRYTEKTDKYGTAIYEICRKDEWMRNGPDSRLP